MEIEKQLDVEGFIIGFNDSVGNACSLWIEGSKMHFSHDMDFTQFSQEDIKTILPYLQAFAETGQLEPSPLQGESLLETAVKKVADLIRQTNEQEKRIQALIETTARMNFRNFEQDREIKMLKKLIKEWRECATTDDYPFSDLDTLQEETSKLLGEE